MPGSKENPNNTTLSADENWILIGRIVGAHGLNGHVKVYPESDFPERFVEPGDRWLKKPGKVPQPIKLTSGRYLEGSKNYLVKLAGVDYRDQAEDLRSAQLVVPAGDRLPLEPGEFHVEDLIGLAVIVQSDQTELGTVTNIFTTGHDLLEVTLAKQATETADALTDEAITAEKATENTGSVRAKAAEKLRRKAKRARKKKKPKTLLIPFVEDIVPVVDIESGRIEITPPPGLIEL